MAAGKPDARRVFSLCGPVRTLTELPGSVLTLSSRTSGPRPCCSYLARSFAWQKQAKLLASCRTSTGRGLVPAVHSRQYG
eukprot:591772-Prorocentrum_lima.AAC.1